MDRVIIYGYLVNIMMVNGLKEIRRDMEFGKAQKEILILVSGKQINPMDLENIFGEIMMYMKENGKLV